MRAKFLWAFASVVSVGAAACFGSMPTWNGTWKLNEFKSKIPGPNFSIAVSSGQFRFYDGTYAYSFRCDGKEYPARDGFSISCVQPSAVAIDFTTKNNGKRIGKAHWELSADGKTLIVDRSSAKTVSSAKPTRVVYLRLYGSTGFAGGWSDKKRLESLPSQLHLALTRRTLKMSFPGNGQYMDPPLDGGDAPCHGPGMQQGLTIAIKRDGPREFLTVKKAYGRIINLGFLSLSANGRILTEEYWAPNRPDQKAVLVYERQ
jgi:hypothetical protein